MSNDDNDEDVDGRKSRNLPNNISFKITTLLQELLRCVVVLARNCQKVPRGEVARLFSASIFTSYFNFNFFVGCDSPV